MRGALSVGAVALAGILAVACGGGARPAIGAMDAMERARSSPGAREGAALAPQEHARAEAERVLARRAYDANDDLGAALHAERASAAYEHSLVLARLARAQREADEAGGALTAATERLRTLATQRAEAERDAEALDKQVKVAREMLLPAPSGPADPAREQARLVAARTLALQARLLCGAARLLAPASKEDGALTATLDGLEKLPARGGPAIDAASQARASCLAALTQARRKALGGSGVSQGDVVLSELSAAAWDPIRDERGVAVALRGAFQGTALTAEATARLRELARVVSSHPGMAVQVVLHDAAPPSTSEATADGQRLAAAVKALSDAGVPGAKIQGEAAGARAPITDPSDEKGRARNARLELVLVVP